MIRAVTASVFLLPLVIPAFGCDSLDVGRPDELEGGPTISAIIVQDGSRRGGRFIATDILLESQPLTACSYTNPCPAEMGKEDLESAFLGLSPPMGGLIQCFYSAEEEMKPLNDQVGVCNDPMHPLVHPAPIGVPAPGFGTQIRVVFSELLDNAVDEALRADGQTIAVLRDSAGMAVPSTTFYDNTGVSLRVAFPFAEPAGPAIVVKPLVEPANYNAGERYTLSLDAAQIKDKSGTAAAIDATYGFTTEALHPYNGIEPDLGAPLDSEDVVQLFLNADVDSTPVTSNAVVMRNGTGVYVTTFVDGNCDGDGDTTQVNFARTSSTGEPLDWEDGDYTYDLSSIVKAAGPMRGALSSDALGTPFAGTFTVTATSADSPNGYTGFTLPSQCP